MITGNLIRQACVAALATLSCASSSFASAAVNRECPNPSKEDREKMAVAHEQMAACLRSNTPAIECHAELAKSQREMMLKAHCPRGKHMLPHEGPKSESKPKTQD